MWDTPLSIVSNSFSSPVMRGMRVHGVLVLVATAYTWGPGSRLRDQVGRLLGEARPWHGTDLGLDVVSHVVGGAAQGDLPDGPGGVVGQIGRQDADPQLALGAGCSAQGHRAPPPSTHRLGPSLGGPTTCLLK